MRPAKWIQPNLCNPKTVLMTSSRSSRFFLPTLVWAAGLSAWPCAQATSAAVTAPPPLALDTWRQCAATTDNQARLACFDAWAQQQEPLTPPPGWAKTADH